MQRASLTPRARHALAAGPALLLALAIGLRWWAWLQIGYADTWDATNAAGEYGAVETMTVYRPPR